MLTEETISSEQESNPFKRLWKNRFFKVTFLSMLTLFVLQNALPWFNFPLSKAIAYYAGKMIPLCILIPAAITFFQKDKQTASDSFSAGLDVKIATSLLILSIIVKAFVAKEMGDYISGATKVLLIYIAAVTVYRWAMYHNGKPESNG